MSRFEKFYNGLSYRVAPIFVLGMMFVTVEVGNIISNVTLSIGDIIALVVGLMASVGTLGLWVVLTLIRKHKNSTRTQSGGGVL